MAKTIEEARKEIDQRKIDGEYLSGLKDIKKYLKDEYEIGELKWRLVELINLLIEEHEIINESKRNTNPTK